ncbi:MAG: helix-turn-helix domain-containing protein [Rhodoglobus sp.]
MTAEDASPQASSIPLDSITRMRALAHPLRMKLLGELRVTSPATVGMLAAQFGESAGSVSYHLKALASGGFIERAEGESDDRRETWWRASHEFTEFSHASSEATPEYRDANNQLRHQAIDVMSGELHLAIEREHELSADWIDAVGFTDMVAFLSSSELAEARQEIDAVLTKWRARSDRERPEAEPVYLISHAVRRP